MFLPLIRLDIFKNYGIYFDVNYYCIMKLTYSTNARSNTPLFIKSNDNYCAKYLDVMNPFQTETF